MTTSGIEDNCQPNDFFPTSIKSLRVPLINCLQIVFTGYFNGYNIEVRSIEESTLLYHMGCFGKGSSSRSKPKAPGNGSPQIMRKRQFLKRNYWTKKFSNCELTSDAEQFLKENDELIARIISDSEKLSKDVIDLVSSDDDDGEDNNDLSSANRRSFHIHDKEDIVVIVPNSDSEDENYFSDLKPKCCVNKIKIQEKLMLTLPEAFFLIYGLGCLQVVNLDNNLLKIQQCWDLFNRIDRNFVSKYVVYHYFRSKGYVVKPGIKFGGDYLLYKEGPGLGHAEYVVLIKYGHEQLEWISILGHVRMANTTVKEIIIVEVIKPICDVKLPEELSAYSVREMMLTRNIPVTINNDD